MSENKHTPGPWATWESPVMQRIGVTGPTAAAAMTATSDIRDKGYANWSEVLTHGSRVAAITLGVTQEEAHANARLIAAAPELLEALIDLRALYDTDEGCRSTPEYIAASAAIAKATGGAA